MEDFAVTEAPGMDDVAATDVATESAAEVQDASTDTEVAEGAPQGEGEQETTEKPGAEFRAVQDGRLHAAAKATLEKLKIENPQLAKAMQRALFAEDRLRRELPGGFKDLEGLRAKIEDLGGDTGIQEFRQELDGWRDFDSKYTSGDPAVLKFLTETPEASSAFLQIAPAAFEKFRELNPDGYGAYVSQVFLADMQAEGLPLMLERLQDFLPTDNPRATAIMQKLIGYVNRISGFASKPISAAAPAKGPADDKRAQELTQREQQLTRTEWRGVADKRHGDIFGTQWKALIGDRKLSDGQLATVKELYGLKLSAILKALPDFTKNLDRYFASNQKDGFVRYFESVYKDAVPKALRTAIQQVGIGEKPGPKGGAPGTPAKAAGTPAKPAPAATGFKMLNSKPSMDLVDRTRTSTDMWLSGKAIMKDGTKTQWNRA